MNDKNKFLSEAPGIIAAVLSVFVPSWTFDLILRYNNDGVVYQAASIAIPVLSAIAFIAALYYLAWRMRVLLSHK